MKKFVIAYIVEIIWTITFLLLMLYENSNSATGLAALNSVGWFVAYGICFLAGIAALLIVGILNILWIRRRKKS